MKLIDIEFIKNIPANSVFLDIIFVDIDRYRFLNIWK